MVILWQDCYGKGNLRKSYRSTVGRRFPMGKVYSYTVKKGYSYLCMWTTSNWLERKKTLIRCGKHSTQKLIWENQHLSLDHVYLGCTHRHCEMSKDVVDNHRTMFESRISAGGTEKLPCSENLRISSWSYDMECHAKKCVERNCELTNKTTQQLYKVSTPCIDQKMDRSLWQTIVFFISYIHHTCDFKQYCHVGNTAKQCRLGLFQDSDFAGNIEDSKSTSGGILCIFGSHTFVPRSWMCKKQTSVSHSSTESEIISLDTGLRLDGIPDPCSTSQNSKTKEIS